MSNNKIDTVGKRWVGVDLDGTLAHYDGWKGMEHIGEPVPAMAERVKKLLAEGVTVKIFTARVCSGQSHHDYMAAYTAISDWCRKHLGCLLPITCEKDFSMVELYDDRCTQVIPNTGMSVEEYYRERIAELENALVLAKVAMDYEGDFLNNMDVLNVEYNDTAAIDPLFEAVGKVMETMPGYRKIYDKEYHAASVRSKQTDSNDMLWPHQQPADKDES